MELFGVFSQSNLLALMPSLSQGKVSLGKYMTQKSMSMLLAFVVIISR